MPTAAPASATSGKDFDPTSSSCRTSSRHSNGGVTAARTTRQKKMAKFPNHSKNSPMRQVAEFTIEESDRACQLGDWGVTAAGDFRLRSLNGSDQGPANRAYCSCASGTAWNGVRYKGI